MNALQQPNAAWVHGRLPYTFQNPPSPCHSRLQAKGWATEVCAGVEEDGYSSNSGLTLFRCDAKSCGCTALWG